MTTTDPNDLLERTPSEDPYPTAIAQLAVDVTDYLLDTAFADVSEPGRRQLRSGVAAILQVSGAYADVVADIDMYAEGIGHASVCVPAGQPNFVTVAHLNRVSPPGTAAGWRVSDDRTFATGQPNPCPCDHDPARKHLLLAC